MGLVNGTVTLENVYDISKVIFEEGKIIWLKQEYKNLRVRYYENPLMADIDDYKFEWSLDI